MEKYNFKENFQIINPYSMFLAGMFLYILFPIIYWKIKISFPLSICILYGRIPFYYAGDLLDKLLLAIFLGIIGIIIGYKFNAANKIADKLPKFINVDKKWATRLSISFFAIGVLAYLIIIFMRGNIKSILNMSFEEKFQSPNLLYPYVAILSRFSEAGLFLLISINDKKHKLSKFFALIITLMLVHFIGGVRIDFIRIVLVIAGFYLFYIKKLRVKFFVSSFLIIFIIFYLIVWGAIRHKTIPVDESKFLNEYFIIDKLDFPMLLDNFLLILDTVPNQIPFQHGSTYARLIYLFIPRFVWQNKPIDMGTWITMNLRGESNSLTSATATNFGEMYLNFGYLGIILGSYILGFLLKVIVIYYKFQQNSKNSMGICVSLILSFLLFEQWRGSFGYTFLIYFVLLLPFIIIYLKKDGIIFKYI
jgi:oligosaccharide repeat unit polymerase